jgi:hypothetical protein
MKLFLLYLIFFSTLNFLFSQSNSNLLINESSENNFDSYILNTGNFIEFDNFSPDAPFLKVSNPFLHNFIFNYKYKNQHKNILELKNENNLSFNMEGSDNFASLFAGFSSKKKYSYLNAELGYFLLDRYNTNQNKYFDDNEVYFDKLNFKVNFCLFDENKYLSFFTENFYGNKSFPSMYMENNLKRENDRWFGKYGFNFGSKTEAFNFDGNFYYAMLNENVSFSNKPEKYYTEYDNINLDLNFDFNLSEKITSSLFFNYYDLQVNNFLFLGNYNGKIVNERINVGFENKQKITNNIKIKYGADFSYAQIDFRDFNQKTEEIYPSLKFQTIYELNNVSNFSINLLHSSLPQFNMSDTAYNTINNTRIAGEYYLMKSGLDLSAGIIYNILDGVSSFSKFTPDTKPYDINNTGLFLKLSGKINKTDFLLKYSMNDLNTGDVLFVNYLAANNLFFKLSQKYNFGFSWNVSVNFKSGIRQFSPDLYKYVAAENFLIVNVKLAYQFIQYIEIYLKANNITNSNFSYDFFLPAHSRAIIGGLNITI